MRLRTAEKIVENLCRRPGDRKSCMIRSRRGRLEDPEPNPTWTYHTDEDYDVLVQDLLASHPSGPATWLFAYGSLIWKQELDHVEARRGTARGWHRSFCFRIERLRDSREQPGLIMSLERGGQCQGVAFRLPPDDLEGQLQRLVRREITVKPPNNIPRWVTVETDQGSLHAITFVMKRQSRFYMGKLPPGQVADVLAKACGNWSSCAGYLHNTVAHLEELAIRDQNLWRLQALDAERIKASASSSEPGTPFPSP